MPSRHAGDPVAPVLAPRSPVLACGAGAVRHVRATRSRARDPVRPPVDCAASRRAGDDLAGHFTRRQDDRVRGRPHSRRPRACTCVRSTRFTSRAVACAAKARSTRSSRPTASRSGSSPAASVARARGRRRVTAHRRLRTQLGRHLVRRRHASSTRPTLSAGLWRVGRKRRHARCSSRSPTARQAGYAHVYPQCLPGTDDILFGSGARRSTLPSCRRRAAPGVTVTPARRNRRRRRHHRVCRQRAPAGRGWRRRGDRRRWTPRDDRAEAPGNRGDPRTSTGSPATSEPGSTSRRTAPWFTCPAIRCGGAWSGSIAMER